MFLVADYFWRRIGMRRIRQSSDPRETIGLSVKVNVDRGAWRKAVTKWLAVSRTATGHFQMLRGYKLKTCYRLSAIFLPASQITISIVLAATVHGLDELTTLSVGPARRMRPRG